MERLAPLTKLVILVCVNLVVFGADDLVVVLIFVLLGMAAIFLRKKLLAEFLGFSIINKKPLFLVFLSIPFSWLIYQDVYLGTFKGVIFLFRLGILIMSALIFVSTTSQYEMIDSLVTLGVPYELAFMLNIAIRFIPVLTREFKEVLDVQRARAYRFRFKNFHAIMIPTVILLLKRSYEVSLAMYTRGFRQTGVFKRHKPRFSAVNYVVILLAIAAVILVYLF